MKLEVYAPCINCMFRKFEIISNLKPEKDCFGESCLVETYVETCVHAPVCKFIDGEQMLGDAEGGELDG